MHGERGGRPEHMAGHSDRRSVLDPAWCWRWEWACWSSFMANNQMTDQTDSSAEIGSHEADTVGESANRSGRPIAARAGSDLRSRRGRLAGAAEAPTKLVNAGFSPFAVSLCMVAGVFTARWTFPTLLKGTTYVFADLFAKAPDCLGDPRRRALGSRQHIHRVRDSRCGLATAFPLWNTNSLVGLLWGRLLFRELQGAHGEKYRQGRVRAVCIVGAAIMLGFSTIQGAGGVPPHALRAFWRQPAPASCGEPCMCLIARLTSAA